MAHTPVNHPLGRLYRLVAGVVGAYILVFGIATVARTWGDDLFARDNIWVLGLRTNLAFGILSVVAGAVIVLAAIVGGNAPHLVNMYGGGVFLGAGIVMLTVLQTDLNFLNFSITTCIVSFVFGMALMTAGLYGKVGPADAAQAEEAYRHFAGPDPTPGRLSTEGRYAHRPTEDPGEGHRFA
ncbi:MAG TPA: DUF4383 domain-containing protein [Micromonosporaceae bacterium]|jgi:hypothetical protein